MNVNGKATLVGIVSWKSDPFNCRPEYPIVFTDVSKYTDWIYEMIDTHGVNERLLKNKRTDNLLFFLKKNRLPDTRLRGSECHGDC